MRDEIEEFYHYLQRLIKIDELSIPSKNYDLVLDIMVAEEERILWSYYYACHEERCLFWLETYDARFATSEVLGVKSPAHVSALYLSRPEFPAVFIDVVRRALFGVTLLVCYLILDWYCKRLYFRGRSHWSLFPAAFNDRRLPLVVYDELMGMLMHGCVGEPIFPGPGFRNEANIDTVDVITSKDSTFPYDDDTMRKMIQLVQAAKSTSVCL